MVFGGCPIGSSPSSPEKLKDVAYTRKISISYSTQRDVEVQTERSYGRTAPPSSEKTGAKLEE